MLLVKGELKVEDPTFWGVINFSKKRYNKKIEALLF